MLFQKTILGFHLKRLPKQCRYFGGCCCQYIMLAACMLSFTSASLDQKLPTPNGHSHLLFEEVLTFDERPEKTLLLLVLQLRIGLFEVLDQVVQRLQHLLDELGHLYGLALRYAVQGPAGEEHRKSKHLISHECKLTQFVYWHSIV